MFTSLRLLLQITFFLVMGFAFCIVQAQDLPKKYDPQTLKNDIDSLVKFIEDTHPDPYYRYPKDSFFYPHRSPPGWRSHCFMFGPPNFSAGRSWQRSAAAVADGLAHAVAPFGRRRRGGLVSSWRPFLRSPQHARGGPAITVPHNGFQRVKKGPKKGG